MGGKYRRIFAHHSIHEAKIELVDEVDDVRADRFQISRYLVAERFDFKGRGEGPDAGDAGDETVAFARGKISHAPVGEKKDFVPGLSKKLARVAHDSLLSEGISERGADHYDSHREYSSIMGNNEAR